MSARFGGKNPKNYRKGIQNRRIIQHEDHTEFTSALLPMGITILSL